MIIHWLFEPSKGLTKLLNSFAENIRFSIPDTKYFRELSKLAKRFFFWLDSSSSKKFVQQFSLYFLSSAEEEWQYNSMRN